MLIGNLTRDPELRVTPKGTSICQFGLAINRTWKDDAGQTREDVTFVDCEAWGKAGENIAKYMTKGRQLFVEGRLQLDQWEDKQTQQKRSRLKVVVENSQFLGSPKDGAPGGDPGAYRGPEQGSAPSAPRTPPGGRPAPAPQHDINDDDVPF
jgi:single-strand DNA-binding protein